MLAPTPGQSPQEPLSLPTGDSVTGVSSQAASLPGGAATIDGMGDGFSMSLSTGVAAVTIPIATPTPRGAVRLPLVLGYSSAGGSGLAGLGWDFGVPFIARDTSRGIPSYVDPPSESAAPPRDRFVFAGAGELIPLCIVASNRSCAAVPSEAMPSWSVGWWYFRARTESAYMRFFWSPDRRTWRVEAKSGVTMELGAELDDVAADTSALEADPGDPSRIYRWNLVRMFDTYGGATPSEYAAAPSNVIVLRYATASDGQVLLTDVYDTPPATAPASPLTSYAHHAHFRYEPRPDPSFSYRRGWRVGAGQRLAGVEVASLPFDTSGNVPRQLVRRYFLHYDPAWHVSLLSKVQVEGRCASPLTEPLDSGSATSPVCPTLPPIAMTYEHVAGYDTKGSAKQPDLTGYEAFDERITTIAASPSSSVDEQLTDLFDINSDGLPDVVVTAPGIYFPNAHAVFLNGWNGGTNAFGPACPLGVSGGALGENATTLTLKNQNVAALDVDGDGVADLVNMPVATRYSVFSPAGSGCSWTWQGRVACDGCSESPQIDFSKDAQHTRVMDVNGDGLVDVVVSTGTEYKTFFALGRHEGGFGRFGHDAGTEGTPQLSNDPVTSCVPWSGQAVDLGDPDVRIADMNGDGLPDIVRLRPGDVRYWPGRGDGHWGTGSLADCAAGTYGANQQIAMADAPQFGAVQGAGLLIDDLNGDGLSDVVEVRYDAVDVYLNVDGAGWTPRHVVANTPPSFLATPRVRLVDANGSGTRDLLWGNGGQYKYIDLQGGRRPWLLKRYENGLGRSTGFEYESSTAQMLRAASNGTPWSRVMPLATTVVSAAVESDNLSIGDAGPWSRRTEYTYADPYFDGRRRDFRGFERATTRVLGDTHTPTLVTDSRTLLGTCVDDTPSDGIDQCAPDQSWSDNPSEALKGLPAEESVHDAGTTTYSTTHRTYTLRTLAQGVDGRLVRSAFQSRTDSWIYDASAAPSSSATTITLHDVEREAGFGVGVMADAHDVTLAPVSFAHVRSEQSIDAFGNATTTTAYGCVDGAQCEQADEAITTTTAYALPSGDPSGWRWRPIETYVTGSAAPLVKRHRTFHAYDVRGALVGDSAELTGTLALDRHHHDGLDVAPAPSGASSDGTLALGTYDYDEFGNVVTRKGPNGQCTTTNYGDDPFRQFATTSTRWIGAVVDGCGTTALSARATYDRALERPLTTTDANGAKSRAEYDAFGRLARRYGPAGVGVESSTPQLVVEYKLAGADSGDPAYSIVHVSEQDGAALSDASYHERWTFVDGMGRTRLVLSEADASHGDGGDWVMSGYTRFDTRGNPFARYHASWSSGSPAIFALRDFTPATPFRSTRFDALGRSVEEKAEDSATIVSKVHHALSVDVWDGEDLKPSGDHAGTPSTAAKDGHGRTIRQTSRLNGGSEMTDVLSEYLPTGELAAIRRVHDGDAAGGVTRWFRYDSLGRRVLNVEPSATVGFTSDTSASADSMKAWRYAYDDSGRLVGTSDARGCGVNFHYDVADRLLAEDYSPCRSGQTYSAPNFANGTGIEVLYRYDSADPDWTNIEDGAGHRLDGSSTYALGRLASVSSLGAKTVYRYDLRGRTTGTARRIAKPGAPSASLADRYAPRWYVQEAAYDAADRPVQRTTGSTAFGATSAVTTAYSARGIAVAVDSTYGLLLASRHVDPDGRPIETTYADAAETQRGTSYDVRGRVSELMTVRSAAPLWSSPAGDYMPPVASDPPVQQLILEDSTYEYDEAGNVTAIHDWRTASEWPDGAKPVSRTIGYDDLYRVTNVAYEYPAANDNWLPLLAEEDADGHSNPSPRVDFDSRVRTESFAYDWLGNTTETTDDALGFYDRSLGTITNGGGSYGPYQLTAASNLSIQGATGRRGDLETSYDEAGNMTGMIVRRDGPCRPSGASCWQRFAYEWDEVGRLSRAFRWDLDATEKSANGVLAAEPPSRAPDVDLAYAYDASDERVLKTATDASAVQRHTVYALGSLELRSAEWTGTDYADTTVTEAVYLPEARLYYSEDDLPSLASGHLHVLLQIGDSLGSASIAIDRDTGELVERGTYTAYGSDESDYRPTRWGSFREAHRFTGKEEDIEVGLTYFGKRYFASRLGRWTSTDPLTIHEAGADFNAYAYVHGRALRDVDPDGRCEILCAVAIGMAIGAGANLLSQAYNNVAYGRPFNTRSFVASVLAGGVSGGVAPLAGGPIMAQAAFGGAAGGATYGAANTGTVSGAVEGAILGGGTSMVASGDLGMAARSAAALGGSVGGASLGRGTVGEVAIATSVGAHLGAWAGGGLGLGSTLGALSGGMNGGLAGLRGVYDWRSPSGSASFALDSTWGIWGTTLGNGVNALNLVYGANYDGAKSYRQNRQVYTNGFSPKPSEFAHTQGNTTSNWYVGDPGPGSGSLLSHESSHIWQNRVFGPVYQGSYLVSFGVLGSSASIAAAGAGTDPGAAFVTVGYYDNWFEYYSYKHNNDGARMNKAPCDTCLVDWW